jgi:hypothetical protein
MTTTAQMEKFAKHYRLLGILYIVYGIINVFIITFGFYMLDAIFAIAEVEQEAIEIMRAVGWPIAIAIVIMAILSVLAGVIINVRKQGTKIFMLILGCLFLFNFPIGTALGVYTIVTYISEQNVKV